jgi:hypothetical protein
MAGADLNPEHPAAPDDTESQDLPDWLKALEPAADTTAPWTSPTPTTTPLPAPREPEKRPERPAAIAASAENAPIATLVEEDDLPKWLRDLAAQTPQPPTTMPEAGRQPASSPQLPSWAATSEPTPAATTDSAPADEAPPVWSSRPARPRLESMASGAMAPSLSEAVVSGGSSDPEPAPTAGDEAKRGGTPWLLYAGGAAVAVLAVIVVITFFLK